MKASKFIVLVGGLLGIISFFLPMVAVSQRDASGTKASVTVSAFQIIKGLEVAKVAVDEADGSHSDVMVHADAQEAKKGLDSIKGIVMAIFAPALLLVLIGGLGVMRKKFGRVAGTFSLLFGLVGLGIAMLLRSAAAETATEGGSGGIALTILLLTGVAGIAGGILALAKPERASAAVA
jgi:hypothetical protein